MFGLGTFGELTFAEASTPSGIYNVSIAEICSAVDASSTLAIFSSAIFETAAAGDVPSSLAVFPTDVTETCSADDTQNGLAIYPNYLIDVLSAVEIQVGSMVVLGKFDLSGEATLAFVGTTKFIDMIEQGEAEVGIAAEIRTRSL